MTRIPYEVLLSEFKRVLISLGFSDQKAGDCATIFANNSRDGVYSHGLNRFPRFVDSVKGGLVKLDTEPVLESETGLIERWNGNFAPGMLNARFCMDRAINLARKNGLGLVALNNNNHWMRGGTYGWQAAEAGCIGMCFTNATALMPPWGGIEPRLGNNPLVIAVPRKDGHIVLDMAMSQYSGGKMEEHQLAGKQLSFYGGYDKGGNLTKDPSAIFESGRLLPIGFWKGSGLAFMLDLVATLLSKGHPTEDIRSGKSEGGISQVFICIDADEQQCEDVANRMLGYIRSSPHENGHDHIFYPGENTLKTRIENLQKGIPVADIVWEKVKNLCL